MYQVVPREVFKLSSSLSILIFENRQRLTLQSLFTPTHQKTFWFLLSALSYLCSLSLIPSALSLFLSSLCFLSFSLFPLLSLFAPAFSLAPALSLLFSLFTCFLFTCSLFTCSLFTCSLFTCSLFTCSLSSFSLLIPYSLCLFVLYISSFSLLNKEFLLPIN